MKRILRIVPISLIVLSTLALGNAWPMPEPPRESFDSVMPQSSDTGITQSRVIGEVTSIDPGSRHISIKTEAGHSVVVVLDDKTEYLRIPPGETSLDKAVKIALAEIGVGDKVYARGKVSDDQKSVPAQKVIVMSKADIQKMHEHERAEWQRRGTS